MYWQTKTTILINTYNDVEKKNLKTKKKNITTMSKVYQLLGIYFVRQKRLHAIYFDGQARFSKK